MSQEYWEMVNRELNHQLFAKDAEIARLRGAIESLTALELVSCAETSSGRLLFSVAWPPDVGGHLTRQPDPAAFARQALEGER